MRLALLIGVLGAGVPAFGLAQEGKADKACPVATVEDGLYCAKCKVVREKDQISEDKCKVCTTPLEKVKACVIRWIPSCGMHNQKPHLKGCCRSKFCCKVQMSKSPVTYACEGCGKSARTEDGIAHDGKEHARKVVKKCEASGTQPHGGEPIID